MHAPGRLLHPYHGMLTLIQNISLCWILPYWKHWECVSVVLQFHVHRTVTLIADVEGVKKLDKGWHKNLCFPLSSARDPLQIRIWSEKGVKCCSSSVSSSSHLVSLASTWGIIVLMGFTIESPKRLWILFFNFSHNNIILNLFKRHINKWKPFSFSPHTNSIIYSNILPLI